MAKTRDQVPNTGQAFDALLVTLAASGDRQAGERLFQRWNPRLLRTARRMLANSDGAQTAAQEAWLAIFRGLPGLRDPQRFGPWAFAILRKVCARKIGRRVQSRARQSDALPDDTPSPAVQDEALALRQAFDRLGPDHRLAAHLHFVEGFTLAEIAEVQSVPIGTAKSRLFHARRQLKAALSGEDQ